MSRLDDEQSRQTGRQLIRRRQGSALLRRTDRQAGCVFGQAELRGRFTKEQLWPCTGGTLLWRLSPRVWFPSAMTLKTNLNLKLDAET